MCFGDGQFSLSADCDHYFCGDCARSSLRAMLRTGQLPPVCPQCRADGDGTNEAAASLERGAIGAAALAFLQLRGVITKEFYFRFLRAARRAAVPPEFETDVAFAVGDEVQAMVAGHWDTKRKGRVTKKHGGTGKGGGGATYDVHLDDKHGGVDLARKPASELRRVLQRVKVGDAVEVDTTADDAAAEEVDDAAAPQQGEEADPAALRFRYAAAAGNPKVTIRADGGPGLAPLAAGATGRATPKGKTAATKVAFVNRSGRALRLVWIDRAGKPVEYAVLGPGKTYRQPTYVGHVWVLASDDDGAPQEKEKTKKKAPVYPFGYSNEKKKVTKKKKKKEKGPPRKQWRKGVVVGANADGSFDVRYGGDGGGGGENNPVTVPAPRVRLAGAGRRGARLAFACPAGCGRYLWEADRTTGVSKKKATLGRCACGAFVCNRCRGEEPFDVEALRGAAAVAHACPEAPRAAAAEDDPETVKLLAKLGKKCPGCGGFVERKAGCRTMMCGTNAHGKVADALRNGGCALIFDWHSLAQCNDGHGYTGLDGKYRKGAGPKTNRQVLMKGYNDGAKYWPDKKYIH